MRERTLSTMPGSLPPSSPPKVWTISSWIWSTSSTLSQCSTGPPWTDSGTLVERARSREGRRSLGPKRISLLNNSRTGLHAIFASSIIRPNWVGRSGPSKEGRHLSPSGRGGRRKRGGVIPVPSVASLRPLLPPLSSCGGGGHLESAVPLPWHQFAGSLWTLGRLSPPSVSH